MKIISLLLTICLAGCGSGSSAPEPVTNSTTPVPPPVTIQSVAFMGDSITARWDMLCGHFQECINAGVYGQTTDAMLARFKTDILDHNPSVVTILGGTNDMYEEVATIDNITTMAQEAAASGALVIIGLVTPANNWLLMTYKGFTGEAAINQWNADLRLMANAYGYRIANYHDAMLLPDGTQDDTLFISDVLHPDEAGYVKMWAVLQPLMIADGVSVN
jgi:lysophospholipase L1-like esterase